MSRHRLTWPEKAGLLLALKNTAPGETRKLQFHTEDEAKAAFSFLKRVTSTPAVRELADTQGDGDV
jgi:hypothetical protein